MQVSQAKAMTAAMAIFFASGGMASAVTDTIFQYATPQVGYLTVHGMAFIPADSVAAANYLIDAEGVHSSFMSGGICFHAPAQFPNGAKVTRLAIWFKGEGSFVLYRNVLGTGAWEQVVATGFSDLSGNRMSATATADSTKQIVDNAHYSYSFELCLNNTNTSSMFSAGRVMYRYSNAGD